MLMENMKSDVSEIPEHPEEGAVVNEMHSLKQKLKANLDLLRALKSDTEGIGEVLNANHEMFERDLQRYVEYLFKK